MIHITSAWSQEYEKLAHLTWDKNKALYAKKHGYPSRFYIHPAQGDIAWNRVECWLDTLKKIPEGDYMLWTGCDALITRPDQRMEKFVEAQKDFHFLVDNCSNAVFADAFFLRSCEATKVMLGALLESRLRGRGGNEQDGFTEYLFQGTMLNYTKMIKLDYTAPDYMDPKIHAKVVKLLSNSPVSVHVFRGSDKFAGDGHSHWPDGMLPITVSWSIEHAIFHQGGKTLDYRMKHMPQYMYSEEAFI